MEKRRVVVTGMGMISPVGNSVRDSWNNIKNGVCGIGPITLFDASANKVRIAAQAKIEISDHLPKAETRKMDRYSQLAVIAAKEAMEQSGMTPDNTDYSRCGVILSSGIGGMDTISNEHGKGLEKGFDRVSPYFIPMTISNMAAGLVAIQTGFRGYCAAPVTACAGGNYAIGDAFRQIRDGYLDAALCGGSEACITPLAVGGFTSMKALNETEDTTRASIPFDAERAGFVIGEGAGCLVLEAYDHAKARGAKIYGEVVGYGATCDAYHMTAPDPEGKGSAACLTQAIQDAGIVPEEIGYINAHGTSTPMNDKCETAAIKMALGEHAKSVLVSSTKSMTGHLLGAAGAVEGIFTILALQDSFVPPTINYRVPDEACDLDVVPNVGRSNTMQYAASNSLGFGGHNATIIFKRYEEA